MRNAAEVTRADGTDPLAVGHDDVAVAVVTDDAAQQAAERADEWTHVIRDPRTGRTGVAFGPDAPPGATVLATLPPLEPADLGDRDFQDRHGIGVAYLAGEMAHGVSSVGMVRALAEAGLMGFYGAGGVPVDRMRRDVDDLARSLRWHPNWGVNLLHAPNDPRAEAGLAETLIAARVPVVSVSAFTEPTAALVRCMASGLTRRPDGRVHRRTRIIAKVSHPGVAERFLQPPPEAILQELMSCGALTDHEAELARLLPVAGDLTVEADSGGHTDNRPLTVLHPVIAGVRAAIAAVFEPAGAVRLGAAGGIGTPAAVAAAFALGADYVLTGSVNQLAVEADVSEAVRGALAEADVDDTVMAPSADMFEQGARVQVLRRGTFFPGRAQRLSMLYQSHHSIDDLPPAARERLERDVFRCSLPEAWAATEHYWSERDPDQLRRAATDPHHRMALLFRSYLGQTSGWAITGNPTRSTDYQIWCGPAVGAFNRWAVTGPLSRPGERSVVRIGQALMAKATALTRLHQLTACGVRATPQCRTVVARPPA